MSQNKNWTQELHNCIVFGRPHNVAAALANGADPNAPTKDNTTGDTALHMAVRIEKSPVPKMLLVAGAEVDKKTNYDSTALHIASLSCNAHHIETLLRNGADHSLHDHKGDTALDVVWGKDVASMMLLIRAGALPQARKGGEDIASTIKIRNQQEALTQLGQCVEPVEMPVMLDKQAMLAPHGEVTRFSIHNIAFWQKFDDVLQGLTAQDEALTRDDMKLGNGQHLLDAAAYFLAEPKVLESLAQNGPGIGHNDLFLPDGKPYHYVTLMAEHGSLGRLFTAELWDGRSVSELRTTLHDLSRHFPDDVAGQVGNVHQLLAVVSASQPQARSAGR